MEYFMRNRIVTTLLCFMYISTGYAGANTAARVNGVADFLIDRANENYLYIFEKAIKDNQTLTCYFPKTKSNLELAGLKELLLSNELWKISLEQDLDTLLTRSTARYIQTTFQVTRLRVSLWGEYIELIEKLELKFNNEFVPINVLPITANSDPALAELRDLVNQFYAGPNDINKALAYFGKFDVTDLCKTPVIGHEEFLKHIDAVYNIHKPIKNLISIFEKQIKSGSLRVKSGVLDLTLDNLESEMRTMLDRITVDDQSKMEDIHKLIDVTDTFRKTDGDMTVKIVTALRDLKEKNQIGDDAFKKIKRHIMFFAQISDAEDADEVSAILKAYTIPAVSYFEKRDHSGRWTIQSYLGVGLGASDVPEGQNDSNNFGIYAPIGIEFTHRGWRGGSLSYLAAPFDFGYPVNLKLSGIEQDVEFDEIVAPSFAISYGFPDYPLALGLVYQSGRTIPGSVDEEERIFLHLSFDMPLVILH